ncbi:conserved Plasmodium protein, unknown function [Plasmodium vinckei vinckei]|uniref:Uncharacterized protein n=1 Tax=Plasmodium vinckei vinckei TaxID=54757 RepID=A0A449BYW0_PLAVN|nr:conserved Plasmodium protein, unknown function [Plasmodium vinckei vinckei]KEG04847.1 hypothetical protein YYE_00422 [Plasmodium vinckei vinckei]VEV58499.1 conserved Plasmodium protein, unknown function [Plasmodium vinckei vinckei]
MDINRSRFNELNEEYEKRNVLKENGLNTNFSYEHILNNNIKRPQEIDCGMSCGSSFYEQFEKFEKFENGNNIFENNLTEQNINSQFIDGTQNLDNNFLDLDKKNNPVYIYNTTNALDLSFKQISKEDFVKDFSNIEINTFNKSNNIIKGTPNPIVYSSDEKKIEQNLNSGCIITKSIYNNKINSDEINESYHENFPYISQSNDEDDFFLNSNSICRAGESVCTTNLESNMVSPYLGSNTVNYSNSVMSEKKLYFPETAKIESNNRYIITQKKKNPSYSSNEIKSNTINSTNIISRPHFEEDPNLVSKLEDGTNKNTNNIEKDDIKNNIKSEIFSLSKEDIYNSVATEIMNYKSTIYDLETELKIKNSYLENEKKKNEGYEQIIEKYINNLNTPSHSNNSMNTYDINEIQAKQIKQELLLKTTEVINLNNAINNLKSQKTLFISSVYSELEASMKKETESSLLLHAQTIKLNNANKYIEKQNTKINNLVNELAKLEQRYIYHVQKDERIINELLSEKKEFVKIAEKLNIVNIENKNKNEELEKYKNKCNELTEELNDLVRVISCDQLDYQKPFNKSYQTNNWGSLMYMPNQKDVENDVSVNHANLTKDKNGSTNSEGNHIRQVHSENDGNSNSNKEDLNNSLKIQLAKLIEHNDWLKSEIDKYSKKNIEIVEELKNKTKIISEQNKSYTLLLEKYNILENDFKNIHDVCSKLEERFKKEQFQNIIENKNICDEVEKNESKELRKRNLSLKDLQINESNQSESNINDYKIYCSELKLENEALKVVVEKLKNKNKKLSKNMELLLNDLITNEQLNNEEIQDNNMVRHSTNIINLDNENNQDNSQTVICGMSKRTTFQRDEDNPQNITLINSAYQKESTILIKNEEPNIEKSYLNESKKSKSTSFADVFTQTEPNEYIKNYVTTGVNTDEKIVSNKCRITDNHINPLIDACINTNKVKVISLDVNIEYKSTQTDEKDCYIKSTQTDFNKTIDRGILTEMCGVTDFNIKQIMIKNKILTKNKKIQVTVPNLNASIQTQEMASSDVSKRYSNTNYNIKHGDKYKYDLFNINKSLRCKKKRNYLKNSSSIYSSNSIDNLELENSSISSDLCSFKNSSKYYYKDERNSYRDVVKRNKGGYYINRKYSSNSYSDTSYDINNYNGISNIYISNEKERHKKNILPICDMDYSREYYIKGNCSSLKSSRKCKNQSRGRYSKSYNRNEEEEVESLLEILKYSSEFENENDEENYEDTQLNNNYRNEGQIEIYRNSIENDSYYKKRMMKYRKREKKRKNRKKIEKINESEKALIRYELDNLSQSHKKYKIYKKLKNYNDMIKIENKHVQTDEQIFDDIFYDDINTNVKNCSNIIDQNVKNLKIKLKEYKNDFFYTAIVCEQCKGLYIDMLLIYIIINYMNYNNCNDSKIPYCNDNLLSSDIDQNKIPIKKASSYTNPNYSNNSVKKNKHRFISNTLNSISYSLSFYKKQTNEEVCDNNVANVMSSSSCEHHQSDKEDTTLDKMKILIHKFVEENIPSGFILCTCSSTVLRYKSIRLKKKPKMDNLKKDNMNNINNEKNNIIFNEIKNVISNLKNELSQIRGTIDNLFFSNKNNILLNNILNVSHFKDIPSIVYNHVHNIETENDDPMHKLLINENDNPLEIFHINKKETTPNSYLLGNMTKREEINICENMKLSKCLYTNQNDLKEHKLYFKYLVENYNIKNVTTFFICCILSLNEINSNLCLPFMKENHSHNSSLPSFDDTPQPDDPVEIEQNEIKEINKIKEAEYFLKEYNIVLSRTSENVCTKQMTKIENALYILSTNIINKIKERHMEIMSIYLLIGEHIDSKNIKITDLMKLIDNYSKIYLYLANLNKTNDDAISLNENEIINSNEKKSPNTIIKSFKLQISEMLKKKDKKSENSQNGNSQMNKQEHEFDDEDGTKCNDKINTCMIKIDELNEEINLLKIKNKKSLESISKDSETIQDNSQRNSNCRHKEKYIKHQEPCSSHSSNINSTCDETNSSVDLDKREKNIESETEESKIEKVHYLKDNKYDEYNEINKEKDGEKKWKKKERNMKHINTLNNIKINEMCNILFTLKEKILTFLSYIYKKLCRNMLINIYYVKRLYTQIVNIFLNIPRDININYLFINTREINSSIYIKKYNDININEKYLELIYNKFQNYSHESLLNMRDKRKNKNKLKKIKYDIHKQYDTDDASSSQKNLSRTMDEEKASHKVINNEKQK